MEDILRSFSTDISSVIVGIFVLLSAFIAMHEIITKTCEIFNVPIKWVKNKNADHNLLIQTTNELKSLEQQHEKDVRESNEHDKNIEDKLDKLSNVILDKQIDDYRYEILDFASALSNGRRYNQESFNHIFNIYGKYEKILEENDMENGLVEESIEFIRDKLKEKLNNGEFN